MTTIEGLNAHAPHPKPGQRNGHEGDPAFAEVWAEVERQRPEATVSDARVRMRPTEPETRVRHPHERRLERAGEDGEGDDAPRSLASTANLPDAGLFQAPSPQAPMSVPSATVEPAGDPGSPAPPSAPGELRHPAALRKAVDGAPPADRLRPDRSVETVEPALPADIRSRTRVVRSETHLGPAIRMPHAADEPRVRGSALPAGAPRAVIEETGWPTPAPLADTPAPALASTEMPRRAESGAAGRAAPAMRPEMRSATEARGEAAGAMTEDSVSAPDLTPAAAGDASEPRSTVKPEPVGLLAPATAAPAEEPQRLPADQASRLVQAISEALSKPVAAPPVSPSGVFVPAARVTESPAALQSPVRRLQLQLQPASLGTVEIEIRSGPRGLAVTITAGRSETARMLEADADLVADLVRSSGHDLEAVSVKVVQADRVAASPDGQSAGGSRSGFGASAGSGDTGGGNQRSGGWEQNGHPARHGGGFEESGNGKDMRGGPDRRGLFV